MNNLITQFDTIREACRYADINGMFQNLLTVAKTLEKQQLIMDSFDLNRIKKQIDLEFEFESEEDAKEFMYWIENLRIKDELVFEGVKIE
jgi:hypothetical protein